VALRLHLCNRRNSVYLFWNILLMLGCVGYVREKYIVQTERWVYIYIHFFLHLFADRTSLVIRRAISTTENISVITRPFFSM
jgi:hypothetical protein